MVALLWGAFYCGIRSLAFMENKKIVAIGKMMIESLNTEWNIPHLHFIVSQTPSGLFEATNIELILDSSGSTLEEAIKTLSGLTIHYITAVMEKGRGYDELIEKANSLVMEEYWREYRNIEFTLARKGKDLSHEIASKINTAIKTMLAEEIRQQIKEMAADAAKIIINNVNVELATLDLAAA
jgi:hypothetical protein